jgi:hypothetical protein
MMLVQKSRQAKFTSTDPTKRTQDARIQEPAISPAISLDPAAVYNVFNIQRHFTSAPTHRRFRAAAMDTWRAVVAIA